MTITTAQQQNAIVTPPNMGHKMTTEGLNDTPRSMLGFMYRGTYFPNFRLAAWDDLAQLFRWFKVDDNKAFVEACTNVDHAAYLLRRYSNDVNATEPSNHGVFAQALQQMAKFAPVQFREALAQIQTQIAAGTLDQFEGMPELPNDTTLSLVYALVYYPQFRAKFLAAGAETNTAASSVRPMLERLARCFEAADPSEVRDCLGQVRDELSHEYEVLAWKICW